MKPHAPFVLMPLVGDDARDILQDFDGQGPGQREEAGCQKALRQGGKKFLRARSAYEAIPSAQHDCLALEAAAREGQRIGYGPMAQVLTCPDVRQRAQLSHHLAQSLVPARPQPAPAGPGPRAH